MVYLILVVALFLVCFSAANLDGNGGPTAWFEETNSIGQSILENNTCSAVLRAVADAPKGCRCVCFPPPSLAGFDLKHLLVGYWKEDQNLRKSLPNFMETMGFNWFEISYASSKNWENTQGIFLSDDETQLTMVGKIGPYATFFEAKLILDNVNIYILSFVRLPLGSDQA